MISARLVGDGDVLGWLRATPDAVSSGLGRVITTLGIELQRRAQQTQVTEQIRTSRVGSLQPNLSLQIEDGGDRILARIATDSDGEAGPVVDVKASLRRIKESSSPPVSKGLFSKRSRPLRTELSRQSFLRSALEEMDPEIREGVEAALRDAVTRG